MVIAVAAVLVVVIVGFARIYKKTDHEALTRILKNRWE